MEVTAFVLSACALLISSAVMVVLFVQRKRSRPRWENTTSNARKALRRTKMLEAAMSAVQRDVSHTKHDIELLIERIRKIEKEKVPNLEETSDRSKREIELLNARIRTVEKESIPALSDWANSAGQQLDETVRRVQDVEASTRELELLVEALRRSSLPTMPRAGKPELELSDAINGIADLTGSGR